MTNTKATYRNVSKRSAIQKKRSGKNRDDLECCICLIRKPKFYFKNGEDMGYMVDTGNIDVRTEGQSYGMMLAVQMDRQDNFDRIWKWTETFMRNHEGPFKGYFGWHAFLMGKR
ncbi:MAG: glycosyl hydrolase family 8 [Alkalibacterium sp.]|nr:glycosyl hydrolase family 8 [Alkalibacterium sp.]